MQRLRGGLQFRYHAVQVGCTFFRYWAISPHIARIESSAMAISINVSAARTHTFSHRMVLLNCFWETRRRDMTPRQVFLVRSHHLSRY